MSEYGYIPEAPEQSFGNNKGIFTPKDIYDLTRADKYTNYGQLELIETQSANSSAVSEVVSAGLRTTVFPVARAGATFQASINKGKFQGIIWPTTPCAFAFVPTPANSSLSAQPA